MAVRYVFSARQHAEPAMYYRKSVGLSVRPSVTHGWISRKRLKLESCSFQRTVAHPSSFCRISFIHKFRRDTPERRRQTRVGRGNKLFGSSNAFARWLHKLDLLSLLQCPTSNLIARWRHCRALTVASAGLSCLFRPWTAIANCITLYKGAH